MNRVLIFNSFYYPNISGGAEIMVQILAEGLLEKGLKPIIVTLSDIEKEKEVNGVKVYYLYHENIYLQASSKNINKFIKLLWYFLNILNFRLLKKIDNILKIEDPDLINTHNLIGFPAFLLKILGKNGIPVVHTLHDYFLLCWRSTMFAKDRNCNKRCLTCKIYSALYRSGLKSVKTIISVSEFILDKHKEFGLFRNTKSNVLGNPLPYKNTAKKRKKIVGKPVFGFVGTISKAKGLEALLNIFSRNFKDVELNIFGKARNRSYGNMIKNRYSSQYIKFHGFTDNTQIFQKMDVLIVPSKWNEPFGRVIIEAHSYGIPVLASRRGGIPENIEEGKTGWIFDSGNEEDLEIKIKKLINNPEIIENMYPDCIKSIRKFKVDKFTKQFINIYRSVLEYD